MSDPSPSTEDSSPGGSPPSERTRLKRTHRRGRHDAATIHAILDACPLCHVAYTLDGSPCVTPTLQWREGDHVYWHGSSASRMLRLSKGRDVCMSVAILDGLVLARSGFHHSVNRRSAMPFGRARLVRGAEAKAARLDRFVESLFPGRRDLLRPMTTQERKATTLPSMPIDERRRRRSATACRSTTRRTMPCRSGPCRSGPCRSGPCRSGPCRSGAGSFRRR